MAGGCDHWAGNLRRLAASAGRVPGRILLGLLLALAVTQIHAQQVQYQYDERGRLASANYDTGVTVSYQYDDNGNLLQRVVTAVEPSGSLQFALAEVSVAEDSGDFTVVVQRLGGTQNAVSVAYATADQEAVAGSDYLAASGSLNWPAGDGSDRTIVLQPIADSVVEPDESFQVNLSTPTGGAQLGSLTQLIVTLLDDDGRIFDDDFES